MPNDQITYLAVDFARLMRKEDGPEELITALNIVVGRPATDEVIGNLWDEWTKETRNA